LLKQYKKLENKANNKPLKKTKTYPQLHKHHKHFFLLKQINKPAGVKLIPENPEHLIVHLFRYYFHLRQVNYKSRKLGMKNP